MALDGSTAVYYVSPGNSSDKCPVSAECHNLSYYIEHQNGYFVSYSELMFLEGTHIASMVLNPIENVTKLSLISMSSNTEIKCAVSFGLHFFNATALLIQSLTFTNCGRLIYRGETTIAAFSFHSVSDLTIVNVTIQSSPGMALHIYNVLRKVYIHSCTFERNNIHNSNISQMGIFYTHCTTETSTVQLIHSKVLNNTHTGLQVQVKCTNINIYFTNMNFSDNTEGHMAVELHSSNGARVLIERCTFNRGQGRMGGAIMLLILPEELMSTKQNCSSCGAGNNVSITVRDSNFTCNHAEAVGGAIYLRQRPLNFETAIITISKCNFEENTIGRDGHGGLAFHSVNYQRQQYIERTEPQYVIIIARCTFVNNALIRNGRNAAGSGVLVFQSDPRVVIEDSKITNNKCSGILAVNSNLVVNGTLTITENNGSSGGGLFLSQNSQIYLHPYTTISIANNTAEHAGGGIFVDDNYQIRPPCFFQLHTDIDNNKSLLNTTQIHLVNNSAKFAGDEIYGGSVESCYLHSNHYKSTGKIYNTIFDTVFNIASDQPSSVSSNPQRVCLCNKYGEQSCGEEVVSTEAFPGGSIDIKVAVVGQRNGTRPGDVSATFPTSIRLDYLQAIQTIENKTCGQLQYNVFTNKPSVTLTLEAKQPGDTSIIEYLKEYRPLSVTITLKCCPLGFYKTETSKGYTCDCIPLLTNHHIECDIKKQLIHGTHPEWIGYKRKNSVTFVVYHNNCPRDYCKVPSTVYDIQTTNGSVDQDEQCAFNRTGILCGACSGTLSIVLGTSNCLQCNKNSWLIIIAFALAGIALVIFLSVLNLTVTEGTLPAIVFYANIVQINSELLFGNAEKSKFISFLKTFIAWINLDVGIEACLYDRMDTLAKALLQFAFPVYIWLISAAIITLSRRSFTVSRLLGNNAVKVLATLILLSYAKLLRAIISGISFTKLYSENNILSFRESLVWKLDGNIPFLHGSHIILFTVASVFGLIMLPFTITLLLIQPLQRVSHIKILCYVQRLKPFFDAYTGAHTARSRYWPGLLLLTRIILFVAYISNKRKVHMISTLLAMFILAWVFRSGVYGKKYMNIIEAASIINLGILFSAATFSLNNPTPYVASASAAITLVLFTGVVCFHAFRQFAIRERTAALIRWSLSRLDIELCQQSTEVSSSEDLPPYRCEERRPLLDVTNEHTPNQNM